MECQFHFGSHFRFWFNLLFFLFYSFFFFSSSLFAPSSRFYFASLRAVQCGSSCIFFFLAPFHHWYRIYDHIFYFLLCNHFEFIITSWLPLLYIGSCIVYINLRSMAENERKLNKLKEYNPRRNKKKRPSSCKPMLPKDVASFFLFWNIFLEELWNSRFLQIDPVNSCNIIFNHVSSPPPWKAKITFAFDHSTTTIIIIIISASSL